MQEHVKFRSRLPDEFVIVGCHFLGVGPYAEDLPQDLLEGDHGVEGRAVGPRLLGAAFALQRRQRLPTQPWDVPLHGAVTETGLQWF